MTREDFVEMTVGGLTLDPTTRTPIVLLNDAANCLQLPIGIGLLEVAAMVAAIEGTTASRPTTHEVLTRVIRDLGMTVARVELHDRRDDCYIARLYLQHGERQIIIDARPSDALELAVRARCSVWVATKILADTGVRQEIRDAEDARSDSSQDTWSTILTTMNVGDFRYRM